MGSGGGASGFAGGFGSGSVHIRDGGVCGGGVSFGTRNEANKVQGCASQVWLGTSVKPNGASGPTLSFVGDSDAHIVRGLIAILFALYSGKPAREILNTDDFAQETANFEFAVAAINRQIGRASCRERV